MSTKDLSRTVIEGGRDRDSKYQRRNSTAAERAEARDYCRKVLIDSDIADEVVINDRQYVYKLFDDKLSPMYRWLDSKVGQLWNDVKSEAYKMFDTRTTSGRHIINDHLVGTVEFQSAIYNRNGEHYFYKNFYFIDDDGYLRKPVLKKIPYRPKGWNKDYKQYLNWLDNRGVGKVGEKMYWFISPVATATYNGGFSYINHRLGLTFSKEFSFRQDKEFSKEDMEMWNKLPKWHQDALLAYSPV